MFRFAVKALGDFARKALSRQTQRRMGTEIVINNSGKSIRVIAQNGTSLEESALENIKSILQNRNISSSYAKTGGVLIERSPHSSADTISIIEDARKQAEKNASQLISKRIDGNTHVLFSALDDNALRKTQETLLSKHGVFSAEVKNIPNPTLLASSNKDNFANDILSIYHKHIL